MNDDDWNLNGKNADLERDVPSKPEILTVVPPTRDDISNAVEATKCDSFGSWISRPNKSDVKIASTEIRYCPYLVVKGRYVAKYLRTNSYDWKVDSDVSSLKIKEDVLDVEKKSIKISDLVAKGVSGLGAGGVIGFAFSPFEGIFQKGVSKVIGTRDVSLMSSKNIHITLLEQAIHDSKEKAFCYDASTASIEDTPDILKCLKKGIKYKDGRPTNQKEFLDFKKAVNDVEKKLVGQLDGRVLEHLFKVSALSFIFLPKVHATLKYKGQTKELVLDGLELQA